MTQKLLIDNKPVSVLLQTIDPEGIADESVCRTVEILLNLVEELNSQVKELREENQRLRSENNRLKGEKGQPDIKAKILDDFWDYYRDLLAYKDSPSEQATEKLRSEFYQLFDTDSGYQQLDERKGLTAAKASELLPVLEHPELPLHNNPAELAARTMVQRRNISYATQTTEGTKAWDTFMSLVATTRKLGISLFEYVRVGAARRRHRISKAGIILPLATIIRFQASLHSFGWSWQAEIEKRNN